MLRYSAILGAVLVLIGAALFTAREFANARSVPFPSDTELRSRLLRATDWVLSRREQVLNEDNAMLWLFIREAAKASGDQRLLALAQEYQSRHTDPWLWHYIFDSSDREHIAYQYMWVPPNFPDYNRLFIYGATCNASVREDPEVVALLDPAACGSILNGVRLVWCRAHQLMGLRLIQRNHCEPENVTAQTVAEVQRAVLREAKWDFRVGDAYIQRVMMLVESGRRQQVQAVWLRRILDAQRADGGWDGVDIVARLPGDHVLSWSRVYPAIIARPASNLHATAQGLYLLALWSRPDLHSVGFLTDSPSGPLALGRQ